MLDDGAGWPGSSRLCDPDEVLPKLGAGDPSAAVELARGAVWDFDAVGEVTRPGAPARRSSSELEAEMDEPGEEALEAGGGVDMLAD